MKQSGMYAIGNFALKLSGLILAPFYLNPEYLLQIEFGQLILLEGIAQIAIVVVGLGIANGLLKYHTDAAYAEIQHFLPFTSFVTTLLVASISLGLFLFLTPFFSTIILDDAELTNLLRLITVYIFCKVVGQVPFMVLRLSERVGLYVLFIVSELILLIGGVVYFLTVRGLGLYGVLYAYVISAAVSTILVSVTLLLRTTLQLDRKMMLRLVAFGAPLVVAGLVTQFLYVGNRFFLNWFGDAEAVAIFGWGARLSGVLNIIVVQSFTLAFTVVGLKALGTPEMDLHLYRRTFRHYVIGSGAVVLLLSLFAYDVTNLLTENPNYLKSHTLILPLSLAFMSFGIANMGMNVLYAKGKSTVISVLFLFAVIVYVVGNLLLIPIWGSIGAAIATLIAYTFLAVVTIYFAELLIRVTYPWKFLIVILVFVIILYLISTPTLSWDPFPRILTRIVLAASYITLIIISGMYSVEEIRTAVNHMCSRLGRGK